MHGFLFINKRLLISCGTGIYAIIYNNYSLTSTSLTWSMLQRTAPRMSIEPATSRTKVFSSTTTPVHSTYTGYKHKLLVDFLMITRLLKLVTCTYMKYPTNITDAANMQLYLYYIFNEPITQFVKKYETTF